VTLLQQQLSLQERIVQSFEQQVTAGAIALSQLLPARITLLKLRLDLADAQRSRADARGRLAEAMGVPTPVLDEIKFSLESTLASGCDFGIDRGTGPTRCFGKPARHSRRLG